MCSRHSEGKRNTHGLPSLSSASTTASSQLRTVIRVAKATSGSLEGHVAEGPELVFQQEQPPQEAEFELGAEAGVGVYRVKGAGGGAHSRQREEPGSKL